MQQSINQYQFQDAMNSLRPDNFSYDAQVSLFNYFEELSDDIGEEIELDVIAVCCEYSEITLSEVNSSYGYMMDEEFEHMSEAIEWLSDRTQVIEVDCDTVVIAQF